MYADDILMLSPSVTVLQELLCVRENVLGSLDLSINPTKSVCTRIGPRCNTIIVTLLALKDMLCIGLILSDVLVFILSDPECLNVILITPSRHSTEPLIRYMGNWQI